METADVVKVFVQAPCEALRPFVKRFLVVEFPYGHKDSHLPDTGLMAAFRYKGDCALDVGIKAPEAAITGLWDIVRLRHVLHLRSKGADFTSIAHAAGYYDQSHFIKDFKQFSGLAPESFFQSAYAA